MGSMNAGSGVNPAGTSGNGYGGNIVVAGPWWTAFGPGGIEGEPPLLEGQFFRLFASPGGGGGGGLGRIG